MDKQLRRILDLVRKTGDRMVVTDTNGEDVYVVMGLSQYEELVGVDEDFDPSDYLDNQDWDEGWWNDYDGLDKPPLSGPDLAESLDVKPDLEPRATSPEPPKDIWEAMPPAGSDAETWDMEQMSPMEMSDLERQFQEYQAQQMADKANEADKATGGKKDEDFGEEQFYLEPVE
jgi:hypothetical protein